MYSDNSMHLWTSLVPRLPSHVRVGGEPGYEAIIGQQPALFWLECEVFANTGTRGSRACPLHSRNHNVSAAYKQMIATFHATVFVCPNMLHSPESSNGGTPDMK